MIIQRHSVYRHRSIIKGKPSGVAGVTRQFLPCWRCPSWSGLVFDKKKNLNNGNSMATTVACRWWNSCSGIEGSVVPDVKPLKMRKNSFIGISLADVTFLLRYSGKIKSVKNGQLYSFWTCIASKLVNQYVRLSLSPSLVFPGFLGWWKKKGHLKCHARFKWCYIRSIKWINDTTF